MQTAQALRVVNGKCDVPSFFPTQSIQIRIETIVHRERNDVPKCPSMLEKYPMIQLLPITILYDASKLPKQRTLSVECAWDNTRECERSEVKEKCKSQMFFTNCALTPCRFFFVQDEVEERFYCSQANR